MGGWSWSLDLGAGTAKIRRMYVDPAVRRRGLAHRLLAALEEEAHAAGVERLVLATGRPQTAAIAMYRAAGYGEIPPFGYYAGSAGVVCLAKTLPATPRSAGDG
jgi:ribosomal protein S18 acetylase RimI-like enzyme